MGVQLYISFKQMKLPERGMDYIRIVDQRSIETIQAVAKTIGGSRLTEGKYPSR